MNFGDINKKRNEMSIFYKVQIKSFAHEIWLQENITQLT